MPIPRRWEQQVIRSGSGTVVTLNVYVDYYDPSILVGLLN
jgi:hypothetical protein